MGGLDVVQSFHALLLFKSRAGLQQSAEIVAPAPAPLPLLLLLLLFSGMCVRLFAGIDASTKFGSANIIITVAAAAAALLLHACVGFCCHRCLPQDLDHPPGQESAAQGGSIRQGTAGGHAR